MWRLPRFTFHALGQLRTRLAPPAIQAPLSVITNYGGCSRSLVTLTTNTLHNAYIQPKLPLYNLQVTRNMNRNARRPKVSIFP